MTAPEAQKIPVDLTTHGHVRVDDYYWLRERDHPDVLAYLEAENGYTEARMAHTADFQEQLFQEIKGRIKQTDASVPYKLDDHFYYTRYEDGMEYPLYCRKRGFLDAAEEVMLNVNELAAEHGFCSVGSLKISPSQNLLAYALDTVGRRVYTIRIKDLETGELLPDILPEVTSNLTWAADDETLFYTRQDSTTLRWFQIFRHTLGTDPERDVLIFEEKDDAFDCYIFRTKSRKYLMIESEQTLSSEVRLLETDDPTGQFRLFEPRRRDHEYSVDHFADHFYIRTNHQAKNFRLMRTPIDRTGFDHWEEVIPHRDDVLLEDFEIFRDYLVVEEREKGLMQLRVRPWSGAEEHYLDFGEPAYLAYSFDNYDFDTSLLRYSYTSMTTPDSVFDYDMAERTKSLLKREEVLGGFSSDDYATQRLYARGRDGVEVPISLVYRRELFKKDGTNPLMLYGYGSYGASTDPTFSSERLSLIDRGFVYAIAHIRGGEELGRRWYEDGKLFNKKNSFTDFIDCAEHLHREKYASPDALFCRGGSAGGLLIGAVVNLRPDLFKGAVAEVPFVDVVTTMLDATIPLTTGEYDEWGNPNEKSHYDYMLSYSPYENVEEKAYPHLLVTTSLHDSQVQYWEPAKWVARLRTQKTDENRLLLRTQMEAGHGGVSGRYKGYREQAFCYAFLLALLGIRE